MAESNLTDTSVTITWDAVVVDGGISEYEVFRDGVSIGTRVGVTFADSGLTADTTYSYTVKAKAKNGEISVESSPLSVTTISTP